MRALEPTIEFYAELLGLRVVERAGDRWAFLAAGNAEHHVLALEAVGAGATGPAERAVGLRHVGFTLPDRRALAVAWRTLARLRRPASAADHRVSWAIYCADPDGNGVELFVDTRAEVGGSEARWRGASAPLSEAEILAYE